MENQDYQAYSAILTAKFITCGLSAQQAADYLKFEADFIRDESREQPVAVPALPCEDCFRTLAEAQRILVASSSTRTSPSIFYPTLSEYEIKRLLATPYSRCEAAKAAICDHFARTADEVNSLYALDTDWLFVESGEVDSLAEYLRTEFSDEALVWQVYRDSALLGLNESRRRIDELKRLLGQELMQKVIAADTNGWIFYRFYSDPVGCIRYMLKSGLSPDTILQAIETNGYILYMYKIGQRRSYNHDQEYIDYLLQCFRDGKFDLKKPRR